MLDASGYKDWGEWWVPEGGKRRAGAAGALFEVHSCAFLWLEMGGLHGIISGMPSAIANERTLTSLRRG